VLRKDRILEALRSMCAQRSAHSGALRRYAGFSAEDVADFAGVDRTNASRDLNLLTNEGKIKRIPGRPVLFTRRANSRQGRLVNHLMDGDKGQKGGASTLY
jgi:transcriptional regulator with AAA-type ATPase domain